MDVWYFVTNLMSDIVRQGNIKIHKDLVIY